ncbi:DUF4870 domain-containing protein [Demequina sediminicola]|uniref:DUF4870 domain-containing protein n=1 Tax=Demequina sediminicola TaxID=1095026 RepID=UPI000782B252|nr:DUF4870 domain-containing protein [Demequina sediminicola]
MARTPDQPPAPATGRYAWALGFLASIPIPYAGLLIGAIAMIAAYPSARRKVSQVCVDNARHAANWGLTILTVAVVCVIYGFIAVAVYPDDAERGFFPLGIIVVVYFLLALAHLIVVVGGTLTAGKGKVFNPRIAIPYLRAPKD